jgi:hypothetical protein
MDKKQIPLTAKYLKSVMEYDPETGIFTWKYRPRQHFASSNAWATWNTRFSGNTVGYISHYGYVVIRIDGRRYQAHRLVWLFVTGKFPLKDMDHRNLSKSDNRFANLREATRSQNVTNTTIRSDNSSGFKGVSYHKISGKWKAQIRAPGKKDHLGYFDLIEDAYAAYCAAAKECFGEFARLK